MEYNELFDMIMDRFVIDMGDCNKKELDNFLIYGDAFVEFYISYRNDIGEIVRRED